MNLFSLAVLVQATPPEPPSLPPTPPTPPTPPPCVDDSAAAHEVYMSIPHIELGHESDTGSEHGCAELLAFGPADVCEPSGYFSTCCKTCTDLAEFQANLPCPTGPADVGEMLFSSKAWSSGRSGYDRWQRPPPVFHTPFLTMAPTAPYQSWGWPSTKVETLIMPIRMGTVDQQKQEITADYDINFAWLDSRLAFNSSCLNDKLVQMTGSQDTATTYLSPIFEDPRELIWVPRIIVDNAFPAGNQPSEILRSHTFQLHPSGRVWWKFRANYRIKCSMDFTRMPFDEQNCYVRMLSVEDRHRIHVFPAETTAAMLEENEYVMNDMSNLEWRCTKLSQARGGNLTRPLDVEKEYLDLKFSLKRETYYWKMQVILPVCLVVAISWCSFFIGRGAAPARVAMSIICFLTISNQRSAVVATLPRLPYSVDLFQYLFVSMSFVFYSVVEYSAANWLMRIEKRFEVAAAKIKSGEAKRAADGAAMVAPANVQVENGDRRSSFGAKDEMAQYRDSHAKQMKELLTGVDKHLINKHGQMVLRDEHLDVFSRYAYPFCYLIYLIAFITAHEGA